MDSNQNAVPNALVEDVVNAQEEEQVSATPSPQPVQQQMGLSLPTYPWSNYRDPIIQQGTRQTTSTSQSQVPSQSMDRSRAELEAQARQRTLEMFGLNAAMFGAVTAPIPYSGRSTPAFPNGAYGLPAMPSSTSTPTQSQSMDRSRAELEAQARQRTLEMFGLNAAMFGAVTAPIPYSGRSTPAFPNGAYGLPAMPSSTSTPTQSQSMDRSRAELEAQARQRTLEMFGLNAAMFGAVTAPIPYSGRSTPAYPNGAYGPSAMASQSSTPAPFPVAQSPFHLRMPQPQFNSTVQQPSFSLPVPQPQSGPSAMTSRSSTPAPFPVAQSPFHLRMPQSQFNSTVQQPSFSLPVPQPQSGATTELTTEINQLVQSKLMKMEADNEELRNKNRTLVTENEEITSKIRDYEKSYMDRKNQNEAAACALKAKDEDFRKLTMEAADNERKLKQQLEDMENEKEADAKQALGDKIKLEKTLEKSSGKQKRELEKKDRHTSSLENNNRDLEGSILDLQAEYAKLYKEDESRIQLLIKYSDFAKNFHEKSRSAIPSSHQVPLRSGKRASSSQRYSLRQGNKKACRDNGEEDEED